MRTITQSIASITTMFTVRLTFNQIVKKVNTNVNHHIIIYHFVVGGLQSVGMLKANLQYVISY